MDHSQAHAFPLIEIAIVIVIAVAFGLGLMRLKQPPLVGFILAGVLMGPTGVGLIATNDNVTALAEMGVLMLLFFIGTELSLKAFVYSLRPALIVAAGQLIVALGIGMAIALLTDSSRAEGVILGFIIAISSTVVAMKVLDDAGALRGDAGKIAVGVLIAQDIAIVPMLIFVSALGGEDVSTLFVAVQITIAVVVLAGLLWWLGRQPKLKLPFAEQIGDNVELLALGSIAGCFSAAAVSGAVGLSPAYGAFIAGLVIGNSNLRTRVIPVIEPIQSILLVVFFLSIGLLIDLNYIWHNIWIVLGATLFVIVAKTFLNVLLLRVTGYDRDTALIGGLSMAQIGEFSFVLAAAGFTAGVLGYDNYRLAIAVTAVTLLLSPAWMSLIHRVEDLATKGYSSYREALAEAYASELENVGEGLWWVRARYRAGRMAMHKRRARKAKAEAARQEAEVLQAAAPDGAQSGDDKSKEQPAPGA
ncbi:MAG: cation:proton antiporter [Rhizobiaceae bacterium]